MPSQSQPFVSKDKKAQTRSTLYAVEVRVCAFNKLKNRHHTQREYNEYISTIN
jgi:hypothetical protein